jgi:hypothetical protein
VLSSIRRMEVVCDLRACAVVAATSMDRGAERTTLGQRLPHREDRPPQPQGALGAEVKGTARTGMRVYDPLYDAHQADLAAIESLGVEIQRHTDGRIRTLKMGLPGTEERRWRLVPPLTRT